MPDVGAVVLAAASWVIGVVTTLFWQRLAKKRESREAAWVILGYLGRVQTACAIWLERDFWDDPGHSPDADVLLRAFRPLGYDVDPCFDALAAARELVLFGRGAAVVVPGGRRKYVAERLSRMEVGMRPIERVIGRTIPALALPEGGNEAGSG